MTNVTNNYFDYYQLLNSSKKDEKQVGFQTKVKFDYYSSYSTYPDILLSYRDNNIFKLQPNSIKLINTKWYQTPTTRKKLKCYSPTHFVNITSSFGIKQIDNYFDYVFYSYFYGQITPPVINVKTTFHSSNFNVYLDNDFTNTSIHPDLDNIFRYYPVYEYMEFKFTQFGPILEQFHLQSLTDLYSELRYNHILESENIEPTTKHLFSELTLEALSINKTILFGVLLGSNIKDEDKFLLKHDNSNRRFKTLETKYKTQILNWIDNSFPNQDKPHLIWFTINLNKDQFTSIQLVKLYDHYYNAR